MPKKGKKSKVAGLNGNVTPTKKNHMPQPAYGVSYRPGKAPSSRKATHK